MKPKEDLTYRSNVLVVSNDFLRSEKTVSNISISQSICFDVDQTNIAKKQAINKS